MLSTRQPKGNFSKHLQNVIKPKLKVLSLIRYSQR